MWRAVTYCSTIACRLKKQYRMHPEVSAWPNKYFYNGELENGVTDEDRTAEYHFEVCWSVHESHCDWPLCLCSKRA